MHTGYTFITDGMAYVRQIKVNNLTYKQFASMLLIYINKCAGSGTRVDTIFDVYTENSIKYVEQVAN